MSTGKNEVNVSTIALDKAGSTELAQLILACHQKKAIFTTEIDTELAHLIEEGDVKALACWLQFNSFIKYQLQKIVSSVNSQELSDALVNQINQFLANYLRQALAKKNITHYEIKDFASNDYIKLFDLEKSWKISNAALGSNDILPLLNAKNRRQKEMGRSGAIIAVSCVDYASEATARKFAKLLSELTPGERRQYLYYHKNGRHTIGFDVERDSFGVYQIFCFESAADPKHFEALDLLYKELNKRGLKFEIKTCQSQLQKDTYNCSIYTLAALSEFSKYDHVFDYLPNQYEEDESLKTTKKVTIASLSTQKTVLLDHMDKISWVPIHAMPTKIIAMGQSYEAMRKTLQKSNDFDLDPDDFLEWHKKKYRFNPAKEQETKYVNQRRRNIVDQFSRGIDPLLKSAYNEFIQQLPLLAIIDQGKVPDFKKEITDNPSMTLDEKLDYIEKLFFAITKQHKITGSTSSLQTVQSYYLESLLQLRQEYLRVLSLKPREEYEKYFKQHSTDLMWKLSLEEPCRKLSVTTVIPLHKIFKATFPKEFVSEYYNQKRIIPDLQITNPLLPLFTGKTATSKDVLSQLDAFEKEYFDGSPASLQMTTDQVITFMHEIMAKCASYEPQTHLLKAASESKPEQLLELITADIERAYIFTEDGQFYFYNKGNKPPLRAVTVHPQAMQKMVELARQEIKNQGENPEEVFHLNNNPMKEIASNIPPRLLNEISLLAGCAPNSDEEIVKKRNLLVLREFYLRYLSRLLSQNKKVALDHWGIWGSELLGIIDVLNKDYPLSQAALDTINALKQAEKSARTDNNNQSNTQSSLPSKMSNAFFSIVEVTSSFFKSSSLRDIVTHYHRKESTEEMNSDTYENHDKFNFKLKIFEPMGRDTRWIQYERCNPPLKTLEPDWKFNLAIHKDDLLKAFAIIAEVANSNNLGVFKIMSLANANRVQNHNNKAMIGREIVIYRNSNLDISAEKWIEIIRDIETRLKKAGVRASTDACPSSNRKLGKYTSYTHEAWTDGRMDIPFKEGIVETALEEDDPFALYEYSATHEGPISTKTVVAKKPTR